MTIINRKDITMKKKILSIVLSASMLFISCAQVFAAPSDIPFNERSVTVSADTVDTEIEAFEKALQKTNNYDKVLEAYKKLMDLSAKIGDTLALNTAEIEKLDYGIDSAYSREELDRSYNECMEYDKKIDLAVKSILQSSYADKFRERWGDERTEMVENISEEIDNSQKEFNDRYYELLENKADGVEFVKLLKEVIAHSGSDDTENTEEETSDLQQMYEYCQSVSDYWYYVNKFRNYGTHMGLSDVKGEIKIENPLETLSFVGKIDSRLKTAYDYLVKNNLCFYDDDGEGYAGTTYPLTTHEDAEVLAAGDEDVIGTLIHEFGHFQSILGAKADSEEVYFGYYPISALAEFESQMFELIATSYYDEIYGENADAMKFRVLVSSFQTLSSAASLTAWEMSLYSDEALNADNEELNAALTNAFGENWYEVCQFYFINPGGYIQYSLTMFDAIQVYYMYLKNPKEGLDKYFEACSYKNGTYEEITEKLGLVSAYDENAAEYIKGITESIFKSEYGMDYATALDYFENGTYLGSVFPTRQKVSVNGGEAQTLMAYNSSGFNYVRIRDLAKLLNGTSAQFDVEYDESKSEVNILPGKAYTSVSDETEEMPEVETAGQKAAGTYSLLCDGNPVSSGGSIFVNGWNCFLLRGLADNGVIEMTVDYDENSDTVLIYTE